MESRTLKITVNPDWRPALRRAAASAFSARGYQGETLNFETPQAFFSRLTARRWAIVQAMLGAGEVPVRELARRMHRDVKRVHEDAAALVALGLLERTERGGLVCPFNEIHIDMHVARLAA
jgi:predicted transcriptional regulator